ncbi:hypothetical protein [Demequina soli]|uniref:hypothetical protein n=1 Tax=Demequina soli TaxID=1638987 RepID=UPI0007838C11|nr:hypothetical protein [Demequina soli]
MSHDAVRLDALIKALGHAYDAAFDDALADRSTTRAEFVLLSVLAGAPDPLAWDAVEGRMPPGYGAGRLTDAWNGLAAGGWVAEEDGLFAATATGRDALADLHVEVDSIHERATDGLTEPQIEAATAALRTMLGNLED